eukprot:jgi/Ulvmu1/528/UM001_0536.1
MAFQIDLSSPEMFQSELIEQRGLVQVLEVYNSWCGPCKPCKELCKRLYFDNADKGLKFYTIDAAVLAQTPQYTGKPHSGSCKPLVVFYKEGAEVEGKRIDGVNYPELLDTVNSLLDA